ncbi:unnamed protein product, partial [Cercopithifilaria johnstoni]
GCCLARLTRLIFALTKALKELRFVSGDMYPMLGNDIIYLNELYLRMKSNYAQYRTLKMKQMASDDKALSLNIRDVKDFQKSGSVNDEVHCNFPEDNTDERNKRLLEESLRRMSTKWKSESDFEEYQTRKHKFHIDSKWKREE